MIMFYEKHNILSVLCSFMLTGPAVRFSESSTVLHHAPPTLGQHTEEILGDILGLSTDTICKLRDTGTVQ